MTRPRLALAAVAVLAVGLPLVSSGFVVLELTIALLFGIAILGLNVLAGWSGQISLGQGAFMALGAFVVAIGSRSAGLPALVTVPLAMVCCGLLGAGLGRAAGRLEGMYLALATFALGVAVPELLKRPADLTGGVRGLVLPPVASPVPILTADQWLYYVCLVVTAGVIVVTRNVLHARPGRAWQSVRDGELAAAAFGVDRMVARAQPFALSAAWAGLAGGLLALTTAFVSADAFPVQLSIALLVGAVIGGVGTISGAFLGGALVVLLPLAGQQLLLPINRPLANAAPGAVQGILLLVVLWVARDGLAGGVRGLMRKDTIVSSATARSALLLILCLGLVACGAPVMAPGGPAASGAGNSSDGEPGVTPTSILIGGTIALSGPAAAYGTIARAADAYFQSVNDAGGIYGRQIVYRYLDDAYSPAQTVPLTRQLVEQDQVFLVYGGLGTQPQAAVRDYLNARQVPQVFVATGATTFSADGARYPFTFGWQPAYQGEALLYAQHLLQTHPTARIGVLAQNDDYGQDYLDGLVRGLGSRASDLIVSRQTNEVGAPDLTSQVLKLKSDGADTLFLFETPSPAIKALVAVAQSGWRPTIYLNSVANPVPYVLAAATSAGDPAAVDGILTANYLKDPLDPALASDSGVQLYRQVMGRYYPEGKVDDSFNVYGMGSAASLVEVLRAAGPTPTRASVLAALNALDDRANPFVAAGVTVRNTPTDRFTISRGYLRRFDAGASRWQDLAGPIDVRGQLTTP